MDTDRRQRPVAYTSRVYVLYIFHSPRQVISGVGGRELVTDCPPPLIYGVEGVQNLLC